MTEQTDVVAEFIKELVSKDVVEAAQLLVSLDYPIPDKKSLILQLDKRKTDNPQDQKADAEFSRPAPGVIAHLAGAFKPVDFGLDTPQSALEKFFARTSQDCSCSSLPEFRPLGLPDFGGPGEEGPFLPTTPEQIEDAFGIDACGRAAGQEWFRYLDTLGPSIQGYVEIEERLNRCRLLIRGLRVRGRCGRTAHNAFARCFMSPDARRPMDTFMDRVTVRECLRKAREDYDRCRSIIGGFGGDSPPGF